MKNYIYREAYIGKLLAYKDKDLIKVVSGLRNSGKSTLFEIYRQTLLEIGVPAQQIVFLKIRNPREAFDYENDD